MFQNEPFEKGHTGILKGTQLFKCEQGRGRFVPLKNCQLKETLDQPTDSQGLFMSTMVFFA